MRPPCQYCGFVDGRDNSTFCPNCGKVYLDRLIPKQPKPAPSSTSTVAPASTFTTVSKVATPPLPQVGPAGEGQRETRLGLYKRDDVRRFVEWALKQTTDIIPRVDPKTGEQAYSNVPEGTQNLLPELNAVGILQKYVLDRAPSCPACEASNFSVRYVCPYCQANDIERGMTIEHYACGHVDLESNFKRGLQLVCPKCSRPLKLIGTDYRRTGTDYRCNSCIKFFDAPLVEFGCGKCSKISKQEELTLQPVYAYKINESLRGELVAHCTLETQFETFLTESGFEVNAPFVVVGLSGIQHAFDLHAWREGTDVVFDFVSAATDIGPEEVSSFFAKIYDTKPRRAILVAMPKISQVAQKLSAMYNLEIIAAGTVAELTEKLALVLNMPKAIPAHITQIGLESAVTRNEADRTLNMSREITAKLMNQIRSEEKSTLTAPSETLSGETERAGSASAITLEDLRKARAEMAGLLNKEIP